MTLLPHRFPKYGTLGLLILLLMETAVFCSQTDVLPGVPWTTVTAWATPACWWGYILLADAWLYRRRGRSLLTTRRDLLVLQCILSTAFWCVFEGYNQLLPAWEYVHASPRLAVRYLEQIITFSTILPGMFLTAELLQTYDLFKKSGRATFQWSPGALNTIMLVGGALCVVPVFLPQKVLPLLWVMVLAGWFLLLEPVNYRRGLPSLLRDWELGDWSRTLRLCVAGAMCGLLWEFWSLWAYTSREYLFWPGSLASWKYFEKPVAGFFCFLPFGLDFFTMFHFIAGFFTREDKLGL